MVRLAPNQQSVDYCTVGSFWCQAFCFNCDGVQPGHQDFSKAPGELIPVWSTVKELGV